METGDNDNEFTISSLNLDEQESKTPEVNNPACESSMERGDNDNKSTVSSPLNLDEQESKTPEEDNHACESSMETDQHTEDPSVSVTSEDTFKINTKSDDLLDSGATNDTATNSRSGKTITAGSVIDHHLKEAKKNNQIYRVLYLVHIRFLVKHLAIDLKKILDDDVHSLEENDCLSSLSATVGRGQDPFKTIVALYFTNMWTPSVCCVCDENNLKELQEKNQAPIIDKTIPCKARGSENFHKSIKIVMDKYIIILESNHNIEFGDTYQIGTQEFESFLSQNKSYCEKKNIRDGVKIFEFLITMNKALIYYNELTAFSATVYLCESLPVPSLSDFKIEKDIHADYTRILSDLKEGAALEDKMEENDKLLQLKRLLTDIFKENPKTKVIILCQTRFNVHLLRQRDPQKFISLFYFLIPWLLKQSVTFDDLNVLISTSIAEQGLNVPECEVVIRYLYVTSDISRRQAHGRARKKDSKCYLIAEENTDHIYRDHRNKQREKEMDDALTTIMTLGEEKFSEEVLKKIKILDEAAELKKCHDSSNKYKIQSEDVQIFCKECHQELCLGSDIIKKGTDYICIDPGFEDKVIRVSTTKQIFRYDSNVGK
ncbi:DHX58 [Acanthosepion pharaonis]|uniref:DHX58 n=1 Tax=Acanthosepion pharaonis TaxID=158019 RepID=A0A812DHL3_ACAPH|nr:DHX58 [Sepia pharaonis]